MEFITTHTEAEALLLESNLIKKLRPRYNVLLKDDKSFPYILITGEHEFARVVKHRGARKRKNNRAGRYFGPFASAGSVNRTISALQRAFLLRNCSDHIFSTRTRPCLQYQIKRCAAPCVGKINKEEYAALVDQAHDFLSGRSHRVQQALGERMQAASDARDFERAAQIRDRIRALSRVQAHQDINISGFGDVDVIAVAQESGHCCIQIFFFRGGRNYGNRAYFPSHDRGDRPEKVLAAFLGQFYEQSPAPKSVLLSIEAPEQQLCRMRTGLFWLHSMLPDMHLHPGGASAPLRGALSTVWRLSYEVELGSAPHRGNASTRSFSGICPFAEF